MTITSSADRATPSVEAVLGVGALRGHLFGPSSGAAPLVLLHGLSFDSRMWLPAIESLQRLDPERGVLALDLPGHGGSARRPSCDPEEVAALVASAVEDAGLVGPVVVGHSMAAIIATVYGAIYPSSGVVNVDQTLDLGFVDMLQANRAMVAGPGFSAMWTMLLSSMHIELLPERARDLLNTGPPPQDVVLAYWQSALDLPREAMQARIDDGLASLRRRCVSYGVIAGHEYDSGYAAWLSEALPQATVTLFPESGHFPHLADPERFAACLARTAEWSAAPAGTPGAPDRR